MSQTKCKNIFFKNENKKLIISTEAYLIFYLSLPDYMAIFQPHMYFYTVSQVQSLSLYSAVRMRSYPPVSRSRQLRVG